MQYLLQHFRADSGPAVFVCEETMQPCLLLARQPPSRRATIQSRVRSSPAKPHRRPTDRAGSSNLPLQGAPRGQHPRGTMAVPQPRVATSLLPGEHVRQPPLHELLHALVLRGPLQEEAECLDVSVKVSQQTPHG